MKDYKKDIAKIKDTLKDLTGQVEALEGTGTNTDDVEGKSLSLTQAAVFLHKPEKSTCLKTLTYAASALDGHTLSNGFAVLEEKTRRVATILMNPKDYQEFRKTGRDVIAVETLAKWMKRGLFAQVWGVYIVLSQEVPQGTVYVLGEDGDPAIDKPIHVVIELH
jgi:hypothetical protein